MALRYIARKMGKKGNEKYYAVSHLPAMRVVTTLDIAKELAENTSLPVGDVVALLEALPETICDNLKQGNRVCLKGLGWFYTTVTSAGYDTPEEITPDRVKFNKVAYKIVPKLAESFSRDIETDRFEKLNISEADLAEFVDLED